MKLIRRIALGTGVAIAAGVLAACGAGDADNGGKLSGTALDECMSQAVALRDSRRAEPPLKVLGPVDMSANRGKTLWIVNAARVPLLQNASDGAKAAAKAAGVDVKAVFGDGSTNSAQAAVKQAIAQKADGIALVAVDPTTIQGAVDQAVRAGVVVTDVGNRSLGDDLRPGVAGQLVYDVPAEMDAMAGWIMADSKCAANALMYSPTSLAVTTTASKALKERYEALCPSCAFELKDLDYGNFASTLTPEVQTDVRRNPDLTHVVAIVGSTVPYVDAALRGSDIRVLTHDGLDANLQALRDGDTNVKADFAFAPNRALGWQIVDQMGRLFRGETDAKELVIPTRLVDEGNIGQDEDDVWPGFAAYENVYLRAWGS